MPPDNTDAAVPRPVIFGVIANGLTAGLVVLFLYLGTTKLLVARASGYVLHSLMVGVALMEVGLLHRPPLAAVACLAAHGLSSWARSTHDRHGAGWYQRNRKG